MNGVRRFLGNPTSAITKDPAGTSRSPSPTKDLPPPPPTSVTTRGLFIRKDRKPPPPVAGPSSTTSSPTTTPPPLRRKIPPPEWEELPDLPPDLPPHPPTNGVKQVNTRDALLLSLMSSEAIVDSRGYDILNAEEVDELKKEHTILSSRVGALQRKLATETKIRDAAQNLARLNSSSSSSTPSSSSRISHQSTTALETSERKVDTAQTELWRVQERSANVTQRLLEHRAGVLVTALAAAERTQAGEEEHDNGDCDGLLSPASSVSGTLTHKFDGAHLFAGHEGALVPAKQQPRSTRRKDLEDLQARLDASKQREAELEDARAAAEAGLEDARSTAVDARAALESELELEHAALEEERKRTTELEGRLAFLELEVESSSARGSDTAVRLEERVRALERELEGVAAGAERVRRGAEVEAEAWAAERARFEQEETRWVQVADGIEGERALWEQEREELSAQAKDQVAAAADGLRALVQRFDVPLFSRESGLSVLVDALRRHLEKQTQSAEESELLLAAEVEKRAALSHELETAKGEIQALQASSRPTSTHTAAEPRPTSALAFAKDATGFVAILQPLWATLPSPEARATRLSGAIRPFRAGSGRTSPSMRPGAPGSPSSNSVSISDMDVRALKSLYSNGATPSTGSPGSPYSPLADGTTATFSVEAFALRVQALIADDRALMERLIRFAQAHDLLKKNAERAQKLAQDSNAALETYQRQVRTLEEQLARSDGLQEELDQLAAEKLAVEERAAEQAETLRQLTEANATLSSRALQLAEDAAAAQEELRSVKTVSEREQAQRLALLEEINLVQTENGTLRQQLRTLGKL